MKVQVLENGPILVEVEKTKMALCRCGHSQNKPYCDGRHKEYGFKGEPIELWPVSIPTEPISEA